jgi:mycoredoxin
MITAETRRRQRLRRGGHQGVAEDSPDDGARNSMMDLPLAGTVTMFSTTWCGYCRVLKRQLQRAGIGYREVNIEHLPEAADYVMAVNGGNQTVPTLLFPDGTASTNPSIAEVVARLQR